MKAFYSWRLVCEAVTYGLLGGLGFLPTPSNWLLLHKQLVQISGILLLTCAAYKIIQTYHNKIVLSNNGLETPISPNKRRFFTWADITESIEQDRFIPRADYETNPQAYIATDIFYSRGFQEALLKVAPEGHSLRLHSESNRT